MSSHTLNTRRRGDSHLPSIDTIEHDPQHHLAGPFMPQTPFDSATPERVVSPGPQRSPINPWIRWAVYPSSAFKIIIVPLVGWVNWELYMPFVLAAVNKFVGPGTVPEALPNPFGPLFLLSHRVPDSSDEDPRYQKGWLDLVFLAYYVVFFSFVRQMVAVKLSHRVARYFGIKKPAKLERFGEQGYAFVYFAVMGLWGYRIMTQLPTYWFQTKYFWIDYPHWDMKPELKRYYLMQMAYWLQQFLVLLLGLEKPRKDYYELVAHHFVTLWLVGWSYLVNLTLIGNAVYMSMDLPDSCLAFSKILNYLQMERAKIVFFVFFMGMWTYFRHILNFYILYSVWTEYDLVPESSKQWSWEAGTYLSGWMRYQVFAPLLLLQLLNLFWYWLILRILWRVLLTATAVDVRSDDEGDDDDEEEEEDGKKD